MLHRSPFADAPGRQPILNVPGIIAALTLLLIGVHAVRTMALSEAADIEVLTYFAFIPVRYTLPETFALPDGFGPRAWTFVTYALLHANWLHLGVNLIWLLAFGTPVARRFGNWRFAVFCAVTAAAGALAHLLTHPDGLMPLVGASAAVSGAMAAAVRFAFAPGAALSPDRGRHADHQPAGSLVENFRDGRVLVFVGAWVALNLLFGLGVSMPGVDDAEVAWQAHIGGFVAGLLLFALFDPVPRRRIA